MLASLSKDQIAKVLIDGPAEMIFDYLVPSEMAEASPGCRVRVPIRNRSSLGTILAIENPTETDYRVKPLTALLTNEPALTAPLLELANWISRYYGAPLEQIVKAILPGTIRSDKSKEKTLLTAVLVSLPKTNDFEKLKKKAPRQGLMLELLSTAPEQTLAIKELGGSSSSLKSLEKLGFIKIESRIEQRDPDKGEVFLKSEKLKPNPEQQKALDCIKQSIDQTDKSPKPLLLHGVTGSGKTEVYLQAAQHALDLGKSVIVLVPEISLTPQTVNRFKSRFADLQNQVAVLHSHLSEGERHDEWMRIRSGEARIAIGARSAIFAPLPDLGLIIVDEEHENSYKQDTSPRYHGRDLAVVRAHLEKCAVVLGSATPALESFHNAQVRKYELIELKSRADQQSLPLVRVVDMRTEPRQKGLPPIISSALRSSIEKKIEQKEQVILFLNRRGFARSLQCPSCGESCGCPHCSIPLTYHRGEERLICHICGHQAIVPAKCPQCNDPSIHFQGYGTEKVEGILHKLFPMAKTARLDGDTARKKNALKNTLNDFRTGKIDLLLGTQMIAKGLDFPNVTLVGVLNADLSLHAPDFRAGERTFSLLTQVAGRAGRGELEGEVIIQTFTPHSPSIQFARHHDYDGFADQELEFRENFHHPPFVHAALITCRSAHERRAQFTLETLHRRLCGDLPKGIVIGDPIPSPLIRAHGQFRFQLLLRSPSARLLTDHAQSVIQRTPTTDDIIVTYDLDPQDFS